MSAEISIPCLDVILVDRETVVANNYNPNSVDTNAMLLLKQSIEDNGFCFPIVTIWSEDDEKYIIVDGFHRFTMCQPKWLDIEQVPIVVLKHDITKRMYATNQFNKARGQHSIELDADMIRALIQQGQTEDEISVHLGIDIETIHRYKQLTGIAELFKNSDYSASWQMGEEE